MVGVPGRSKGCRTCRRRRIKCDERQPLCARCERGGFECEGFGRDLSFVSENSNAKQRSLKQEALRAKACEGETASAEEFLIGSSTKDVIGSESNALSSTPTRLWPQLNYAGFKDEIQISFTLSKLFAGDEKSAAWLGHGYNTSEYRINSDALRALSGVYFGRQHHESSSETNGRLLYLKTLRGLSKAIASNRGMSLDVLLAGMTASCYEMIASPSYLEMLLHAGGVGRLIELRGPERHCGIFELRLLNAMRVSICAESLLTRKRCFLEKDEWKTIPWSLHPEEKTMAEWVRDIMCDIPGLYEDYDALFASDISPETYQICLESLKDNINHHLCLLFDWRALWENTYIGICQEQTSRSSQCPFAEVLHYQDLEVASGLMLYNALYITMSQLGLRLLGPDFEYRQLATKTKFDSKNPLLNPPGASTYDSAIEICRSVEYHLSPPHGSAGMFFIMYPMRKAHENLPSGSAEKEWLEIMMMNLATKSGFLSSTALMQVSENEGSQDSITSSVYA